MELGLPRGALVVLVVRGEESMVPTGATVLHEGDKLVMVVDEGAQEAVAGKL
jgi:cell volume regulation protein A